MVLYLYMILGPPLPGPGFFHQILAISGYFWVLPAASICLTNPRFEINDLKSMIWNLCLLMITDCIAPLPGLGLGLSSSLSRLISRLTLVELSSL